MPWKLWFIQLSGWPVFLAVVVAVCAFMMALSVFMTWMGNRSVAQNAILAVMSVALLMFGLLGLGALLTRL